MASFLMNGIVYVALFAVLVYFCDRIKPVSERIYKVGAMFIVVSVTRLVAGYYIGIPFFGIADLFLCFGEHVIGGGQIAQGLAFELSWMTAVICFTVKKWKWLGIAATVFVLVCALSILMPSSYEVVVKNIGQLDQATVQSLTPDQLKSRLTKNIKHKGKGFFEDRMFDIIEEFRIKSDLVTTPKDFLELKDKLEADMVKLLYQKQKAMGSRVVYLKEWIRYDVRPLVVKHAITWSRLLIVLVFMLAYGFLVFKGTNPKLAEYCRKLPALSFFFLVIGLILLSGTRVGNSLNNIPKFLFGDFSSLLSTRQGAYIFLAVILAVLGIGLACLKGKIGIWPVIAVVALGLIGWYKFAPKPLPPTLYELGYVKLAVAGADWGTKKVSIIKVPVEVPLWWSDKGERQLGMLFASGQSGRPTGGHPILTWLRKEDVAKLSEPKRAQLGVVIDRAGNVFAPKGLLGVKYELY